MGNMPTTETSQKKRLDLVTYEAADGVPVELTASTVREYLVRGRKELVTNSELLFFLNICRARGLNPFTNDVYLIKYTQNDPAQIIVSIDFLRAHAKGSDDCEGWDKGIIVLTKDGKVNRTHGLLLDDEKLLGGWFEATPKGWAGPVRVEVNLSGYIKKTKDGSITKFWSPENQPTMISKVAEAQGLRTAWPKRVGKLYVAGEAPAEFDDFENPNDGLGSGSDVIDTVDQAKVAQFDVNIKREVFALVKKPGDDLLDKIADTIAEFVNQCAAANGDVAVDAIKAEAVGDWTDFYGALKPRIEKVITEHEPKDSGPGNGPQTDGEGFQDTENEEAEAIISGFMNLRKPGILEFEKTERDNIEAWPTKAIRAFVDKVARLGLGAYIPGRGFAENSEGGGDNSNQDEDQEGDFLESIMCGTKGKYVTKDICDNDCPYCQDGQDLRCRAYNEKWGGKRK
jgi:phage recombination protein Bet